MKINPKVVIAFFVDQGLPAPVTECMFHPTRKWRFDFAWPDYKVALEVDGGIWVSGRHNRGAAMKAQWEKENEAQAMGWRILKCEPRDVCIEETLNFIKRCMLYEAMPVRRHVI